MKKKVIKFTGKNYLYSGKELPEFLGWAIQNTSINPNNPRPAQEDMEIDPPMNVKHEFLKQIIEEKKCFSRVSF